MPRSLFWRTLTIARIRLGSWIIGDGYLGYVSWLVLVRDRARVAVQANGSVVLADCESLADALYRETPGQWDLRLTRLADPPDVQPSSRRDAARG